MPPLAGFVTLPLHPPACGRVHCDRGLGAPARCRTGAPGPSRPGRCTVTRTILALSLSACAGLLVLHVAPGRAQPPANNPYGPGQQAANPYGQMRGGEGQVADPV